MKKLCLGMLTIYCMSSTMLSAKIDLLEVNRDLLGAVAVSLQKVSNIASSLVATCAHNYFVRRSSGNLFDTRDPHLLACITGGWFGDVLNNALSKRGLPSYVRVPLSHSFAFSWLAYNLIVNKASVLDPKNIAVGCYLVLNGVDRYWNDKPWIYDAK